MSCLIGEFECKVDAKGRFMLPSGLIKQLSEDDRKSFVINRGFEKNLTLYPQSEWSKISREVLALNQYIKKNIVFVRYFFRGATEVVPDNSNRILITKSLLEYAGVKGDLVLFAYGQKIEIWAKESYEAVLQSEPDDFAQLAEEVMGKLSNPSSNENLS